MQDKKKTENSFKSEHSFYELKIYENGKYLDIVWGIVSYKNKN